MSRILPLLLALIVGAVAGATLVRVYTDRQGPVAPGRDLVATPGMAEAAVEAHRRENYRDLDSVEAVFALPTAFARSEALHVLAGRSDPAAVQRHIFAADRIADETERENALGIFFSRLAELDAPSALALARTDFFKGTRSLEQAVWSAWARKDFDGALFAAKTRTTATEQNDAAQALFAAFGFMGNEVTDRIEQELGIGPDRSQRARYLYKLADNSVSDAVDYIAALPAGTEKTWNINWLAYYLSLRDAKGALGYARLFDDKAAREQFEAVIKAEAGREDPATTIEQYLAVSGNKLWSAELRAAIDELVDRDPDLLLDYLDRAESDDARTFIAHSYLQALAATDPTAAIEWAKQNNVNRRFGMNLMYTALMSIAPSDPRLAVAETLKLPPAERNSGILDSVFGQVAEHDPRLALALADDIENEQERRSARGSVVMQWLRSEPDAAVAWIDTLEPEEAAETLRQNGMMLAHVNPELAIRLLPRIDEADQPMWRVQIAQQLAASGSVEEALAFTRRFESEPGYAGLQANVVAAVAEIDVERAMQLVQQLPDAAARDQALAQIASQQSQYHFAEAVTTIASIEDPNLRATAASNIAMNWVREDAAAATRWLASLPPGAVRDNAIRGAVAAADAPAPELLRMVDDISDAEIRGQAKANMAWQLMRTNPDQARRLLEDPEIPEHMRLDLENALDNPNRFR